MKTVIHYKKQQLIQPLVLGLVYLIIGMTPLLLATDNYFYVFIVLGLLYLAIYWHRKTRQYAVIEDNTITKNTLVPMRINFSDVIDATRFAGAFRFKTESKELVIETAMVDKKSLMELERIFLESNSADAAS